MATLKIVRKDPEINLSLTAAELVGLSTIVRKVLTIGTVDSLGLSGLLRVLDNVPVATCNSSFNYKFDMEPPINKFLGNT